MGTLYSEVVILGHFGRGGCLPVCLEGALSSERLD